VYAIESVRRVRRNGRDVPADEIPPLFSLAHGADARAGSRSQQLFRGRRPEDGRIDWRASAVEIHNLVRAVAPPYPGAFTLVGEEPLRILRALPVAARSPTNAGPALFVEQGRLYARCGDGGLLRILAADFGGNALDASSFE
ncbi:MAG: hypothetical protein ACLGHY_04880, partial [Gammaproteobacteria bacterium]